jgi:O-antigen/teichoic acid export membrane protein
VALTESQPSDRLAQSPVAALLARLKRWHADHSHDSIAQRVAGTAFMIRVASAALIYLTQILFARWMGSFEFGIYVYVWTWVLVIGELADLGMPSAAQRFVPEYTQRNAHDLLRGFLSRSRWITFGAASGVAVVSALAVKLVEPWLANYVVLPLMIACVTLPFYALMSMQDGIARSYNWIHLALLPLFVVRNVVMLVLVTAAYFLNFPTDAVTVVSLVGMSFALTSIGQTIVLNRRLKQVTEPGKKTAEMRTWLSASLPILVVGGFYHLLTHTDILVLQHFRSPDDVAVFYAAVKTLALVAFVYFAVSAAVAHRFTEYHVAGDRERLAEFLASSIRWTFWPSLAATIVMLVMGKMLLSLFGANFVDGYHLMFILSVGLLARAAIGPVERLLNMLGEQRICAIVYGVVCVLNLALCILLAPRFGMEGAAISTSTALIVESVLLFWVTKVRLGYHVFIWGRRPAG